MSSNTTDITSSAVEVPQSRPCAHAACVCIAASDSDYCGSYCAGAKDDYQHGDGCGCAHDACRAQ